MENEKTIIRADVVYQYYRMKAEEWESQNPILEQTEPGFVLDNNGKAIGLKIGDGMTHWNDLELIPFGTDKKYMSDSDRAQSGKAVAEAIANIEIPSGANGEDGFSPTVEVTETEEGHTLSITDVNGTQSFDVLDGEQGIQGPQGEKGEKGDPGEVTLDYANNTFANAIRNSASGEIVAVNDVSSLPHKLNVNLRRKNLIPYPYAETTKTENGLSITDNGDGTITIDGTANNVVLFHFVEKNTDIIERLRNEQSTTFYFNVEGFEGLDGCVWWFEFYDKDGELVTTCDGDDSRPDEFNLLDYPSVYSMDAYVVFYDQNIFYDSVVLKPQIGVGSPVVTDLSDVSVIRNGKNLFDIGTKSDYYLRHTAVENNFVISGNSMIGINGSGASMWAINTANKYPAGVYSFSADFEQGTNKRLFIQPYGAYGAVLTDSDITISGWAYNSFYNAWYKDNVGNITVNIPNTVAYWHFGVCFFKPGEPSYNDGGSTLTVSNIQIEVGNKVTAYEEYTEQTANANADGTVNGLTPVSPNMTLRTDTQGVFINLTYNADTKMYIDNKFNELSVALLNN